MFASDPQSPIPRIKDQTLHKLFKEQSKSPKPMSKERKTPVNHAHSSGSSIALAVKEVVEVGEFIDVNDTMQTGYRYKLSAPVGENFSTDFRPLLSPKQMLEAGVFEGKYCNDCTYEFPQSWYENARISQTPDPALNYFGLKSRQPLSVWRQKGWIYGPDPRGWFQWYCRYYIGRRLPNIDQIQIKRWRAFSRHAGQIRANCEPGDIFCRRRQRQALLQWSYDPLI